MFSSHRTDGMHRQQDSLEANDCCFAMRQHATCSWSRSGCGSEAVLKTGSPCRYRLVLRTTSHYPWDVPSPRRKTLGIHEVIAGLGNKARVEREILRTSSDTRLRRVRECYAASSPDTIARGSSRLARVPAYKIGWLD